MEDSKRQEQVINLGKLLVKELGIENSTDTLSRWMAHYVADKILFIESLPAGREKEDAQKECFEIILKLWENRWELPAGKRPLGDYEPILRVLEKIDPEKEAPFFYRQERQIPLSKENDNEINKYLEIIVQIDKVARIWIDFLLQQATSKATDEQTKSILENAIEIPHSDDIAAIRILFDDMEDYAQKYKDETFRKRIEELEKFAELNKFILEEYKNDFLDAEE